ncbi:hypothetical protein LH612_31005, partial [Klebsiella pneumoniae]|nr:hypothetical protein [Klebsiella pneumoniae]
MGLIVLVFVGWFVRDVTGPQHQVPGAESGLPVRPISSLPPEVEQTWELINRGGPFPFPEKDGTVFGNREELLPNKPRGYYREYTVPTPGSSDRGARRLVTGEESELYY